VALALALLVVGGISLVNALTSESAPPAPETPTITATSAPRTEAPSEPVAGTVPALQINVIGGPTNVVVKEPGTSGTILERGLLNPGEIRTYDQAPLYVVVDNSASVEVRIYGKLKRDADGGRGQWEVPRK
jgi:hypothetical protein